MGHLRRQEAHTILRNSFFYVNMQIFEYVCNCPPIFYSEFSQTFPRLCARPMRQTLLAGAPRLVETPTPEQFPLTEYMAGSGFCAACNGRLQEVGVGCHQGRLCGEMTLLHWVLTTSGRFHRRRLEDRVQGPQ